jgi:hypothetical protein
VTEATRTSWSSPVKRDGVMLSMKVRSETRDAKAARAPSKSEQLKLHVAAVVSEHGRVTRAELSSLLPEAAKRTLDRVLSKPDGQDGGRA